MHHVVINSAGERQLALRHGVSSVLIPNVMDFEASLPAPDGYADDLRETLGIDSNSYLILQPTRIVPRKRIEQAIELVRRLDLPAVLLISHAGGDEGTEYEAYLRAAFRDRMLASKGKAWWLGGGGRSALNLDGLAYWLHAVDPAHAEMRAMLATAVCSMFSSESEHSMLKLIESPALSHDAWIYICFGGLSLADVVQPMVSMEDFVPDSIP